MPGRRLVRIPRRWEQPRVPDRRLLHPDLVQPAPPVHGAGIEVDVGSAQLADGADPVPHLVRQHQRQVELRRHLRRDAAERLSSTARERIWAHPCAAGSGSSGRCNLGPKAGTVTSAERFLRTGLSRPWERRGRAIDRAARSMEPVSTRTRDCRADSVVSSISTA